MKPWEQYQQQEPKPWEQFQSDQPPSQEKGFFGRVGEDISNRTNKMAEIRSLTNAGEQTGLESVMQQAGQIAALGGDVAFEGIKSGIKGYPALEQNLSNLSSTKVGRALGGAAAKVGEKYGQVAEAYPRAARNVEGVANITLNAFPIAKGAQYTGEVAGGVRKAAASRNFILKSSEAFDEARKGYKFAEDAGVSLKPASLLGAVENAASEIKPKGSLTLAKPTIATEYIANLKNKIGTKPLTFDDVVGVDQELTGLINDRFNLGTGGYTAEGNELKKLRQSIRDIMTDAAENPSKHVVGGDARGVNAYQQATKIWSKAIKLKSAENVIERGVRAQQPATSIATGFKNFALNDKKMAGLSKEAKKAAFEASKKAFLVDKVATLGSRLLPIGGAVGGGIPGYLVGEGVSSAARGVATAAQLKKAKKLLSAISKDGRFVEPPLPPSSAVAPEAMRLLPSPTSARPMSQAEINSARNNLSVGDINVKSGSIPYDFGDVPYNYISPEPPAVMKYLPAPAKDIVIGKEGARYSTAAEEAANAAARQRAAELGLTPDVIMAIESRGKTLSEVMKMSPSEAKKYLGKRK